MYRKLLSIFIIFTLFTSITYANENVEDDLSGFSDSEVSENFDELDGFSEDEELGSEELIIKDEDKIKSKSRIKFGGDIAFKTAYGVKGHEVNGIEYKGFTQAQTALSLSLDAKLNDNFKVIVNANTFYDAIYDLNPSNEYHDDVLDAYETQVRFDDLYIQGSLTDDLDVKLGRQIVIWGKSDSIRVTDVINPLDNRQPGLTDIEDLRLPTTMLKLDYYIGDWELSAMAIGESRVMIEAPARSEFFNIDGILGGSAPDQFFELVQPENSWENMQYAFGANGIFSGWDLSFYVADVLDQKWHIENSKRVISKVKMAGSALNIAYGSWLIKTELAYLNGVRYNSSVDAKNRLNLLAGFDYMGFKDTVISIEVANRHIYDYEPQMEGEMDYIQKDETQTAMRYTKNFLNDTLDFSSLLSMFGSSWQNGGFLRVWLEYDIIDALNIELGYVEYIGGDKPFMEVNKDNDRLFANIKYSF